MKRFGMIVAVAGMIMLLGAHDLMAQRGGGGGRRGGAGGQRGGVNANLPTQLLTIKEVQEEIGINDDQQELVEKAEKLNEDMRAEMREIFSGGGGDRDAMMEELREYVEELTEDANKIIAKLDDDQRDRLRELRFQQLASRGSLLSDDEAKEVLGITEDQAKEIQQVMDDGQTALREAMQEARESGDREGMREIMQESQEETMENVMEVLTDDQKEKMEEMQGEKFEFPQRQRQRGRQRSDF